MILALLATVLLVVAWGLPANRSFIVSGRLWPVLASGGVLVAASWIAVWAYTRHPDDEPVGAVAPRSADEDEGAVATRPMSHADRIRVAGIAGALVLFTWAAPWVGYGIGLFVLVLLVGVMVGGRAHLSRSLVTAAVTALMAMLLFERGLQISLPDGVLFPSFFSMIGG